MRSTEKKLLTGGISPLPRPLRARLADDWLKVKPSGGYYSLK
jgi:hypothetical protein